MKRPDETGEGRSVAHSTGAGLATNAESPRDNQTCRRTTELIQFNAPNFFDLGLGRKPLTRINDAKEKQACPKTNQDNMHSFAIAQDTYRSEDLILIKPP